jgi:regulator of replication initiation timing
MGLGARPQLAFLTKPKFAICGIFFGKRREKSKRCENIFFKYLTVN